LIVHDKVAKVLNHWGHILGSSHAQTYSIRIRIWKSIPLKNPFKLNDLLAFSDSPKPCFTKLPKSLSLLVQTIMV